MKTLNLENHEKLTPIGGRASVYFADYTDYEKFQDICQANNLSASEVIANFVREFNEKNK